MKNKEGKRSADEFTTTAHMILMEDVATGERMRRRKQDFVLYILFTSYSAGIGVTHSLCLFFSRKCDRLTPVANLPFLVEYFTPYQAIVCLGEAVYNYAV